MKKSFIIVLGIIIVFFACNKKDQSTSDKSSTPTYQDPTASAGAPNTLSAVLFGMHMGPGIDLELNKNMFFGASVTFHTTFGTTQNMANGTPLSIGGTYTSFLLHLGATF